MFQTNSREVEANSSVVASVSFGSFQTNSREVEADELADSTELLDVSDELS